MSKQSVLCLKKKENHYRLIMSTFAGNKQLELAQRGKKNQWCQSTSTTISVGKAGAGTRRSNLELPNLQHFMKWWGKGLLILPAYKKTTAGTQGSQARWANHWKPLGNQQCRIFSWGIGHFRTNITLWPAPEDRNRERGDLNAKITTTALCILFSSPWLYSTFFCLCWCFRNVNHKLTDTLKASQAYIPCYIKIWQVLLVLLLLNCLTLLFPACTL